MTTKIMSAIDPKFETNFAKIFGTKEERAKRKKETDKKVEAFKQASKSAYISGNFEAFKSPIDGSIISCRSQLRTHNKKHGVTDIRDYSEEHFESHRERRENETIGNTKQAQNERKQLCHDVLKHYGLIR